MKNRFYNYSFDKLVRAKTLETKNILIDEINYQDFILYFVRYVHGKSKKY